MRADNEAGLFFGIGIQIRDSGILEGKLAFAKMDREPQLHWYSSMG